MNKGQWHQTKGHNEIMRPYLIPPRKRESDGLWRPILAFLVFMAWLMAIVGGLSDSWGLK